MEYEWKNSGKESTCQQIFPKRRFFLYFLLPFAIFLLFLSFREASGVAMRCVTSGADDGSAGTLRYVLAVANPGDTIRFDGAGTDVRLTAELVIRNGLTFIGPATITQTGNCRVLFVNEVICTLRHLTIQGGRVPFPNSGGGIFCTGTIIMESCTLRDNAASLQGGGLMLEEKASAILRGCTIQHNRAHQGGGIYKPGGSYNAASLRLEEGCIITDNSEDNINATYSTDGSCTIGDTPNRSATAFGGYAGDTEPQPRSIVDDTDVDAVSRDLTNTESHLFQSVAEALSADLGELSGETSVSFSELNACLYYANAFENVALESTDLSVEYTASWPERVRYYSLFSRADGSGYEIPERGIQFELRPGQDLPKEATPPEFYETGEGLMTWRNLVTDNGSFDLNPEEGMVTFRVCSVRAETKASASKGGGSGGCNVGAGMASGPSLLLLLGIPLGISLHKKK